MVKLRRIRFRRIRYPLYSSIYLLPEVFSDPPSNTGQEFDPCLSKRWSADMWAQTLKVKMLYGKNFCPQDALFLVSNIFLLKHNLRWLIMRCFFGRGCFLISCVVFVWFVFRKVCAHRRPCSRKLVSNACETLWGQESRRRRPRALLGLTRRNASSAFRTRDVQSRGEAK